MTDHPSMSDADELTRSEQALSLYFFSIAGRPQIKAAGYDPRKFLAAFFTCVSEDVPAVMKHAFRSKLVESEAQVRGMTRAVLGTVLGGVVHPDIGKHVQGATDEAIKLGVDWLARKLAKKGPKK